MIHNEAIETFVEGTPVELVRDGVIQHQGLERAKLSREDLFEALRAEHVRQLGQVERAYFEQDGHLSVFIHQEKDAAPPGLPVVPPWDLELPPPVTAGHPGPVACLNCGRVQEAAGTCACGEHHWVAATTDPLA